MQRNQCVAGAQVKRYTNSMGDTEDKLVLLSKPTLTVPRLPGVGLYYSDAIRGVPHPLVQLVRFSTLSAIKHCIIPECPLLVSSCGGHLGALQGK